MGSLEKIKEAAAQWVARRHGGGWTPADDAMLNEWLNASIDHRVEFLGHEKTWRDANRLKLLAAGQDPTVVGTRGQWQQSPYFRHIQEDAALPPLAQQVPFSRRSRTQIFGMVATALITCAASYVGWGYLHGNRYSTQIGVTTAVPLPDGSKIILNTASEIRVAVTQTERRIELDQGEAFFEVAEDPLRPFTVVTGDRQIVAVGTKFSVRRDASDIRVVVTEGKVRILGSSSLTNGRSERGTLLNAGSIARTRGEEVVVSQQPLLKAEQLLSWREGYLMFDEVTLAEAVAEFNRYNIRKFVIKDAAIASLPVTGHFRSTSVESFAGLLQQGFPVGVTRKDGMIVLTAREAATTTAQSHIHTKVQE